jgi:AcrR family transcriptional regulator
VNQTNVAAPSQDRRVRRSRTALTRAAIALVSERGTAAVPISEIADAADVSRQVVYQQFGDRDTLLLVAATELAQGELLPQLVDAPHPMAERSRTLAMAQHFADHRAFYRAMLTGSCAFALNRTLTELLIPLNHDFIKRLSAEQLDPGTVDDLASFLTGGAAALFNAWVVEGTDPLDPEAFTDRLMRMASAILARIPQNTSTPQDDSMTQDREPHR